LLPHPLSPTTHTVWPRSTWKATPSTALTTPSSVKKCVRRPFTSSSSRSAIGVRRVTQPVSEEVHTQHRQHHRAAEREEPGRAGHGPDVLRLVEQQSPADDRWTQAKAEERECRLRQDHRWDR